MASHGAGGHTSRGLLLVIVLLVAALVFVSCFMNPLPRATPAPPFSTNVDSTSRGAIIAYADTLEFTHLYATGETRRLMRGTCPGSCSYGPLVRLEPETGSVALDSAALWHGRIIARLVNLSVGPADSYPKFSLAPGDTSYWWVDGRTGTWRSYFISRDTLRSFAPDTFILHVDVNHYHWKVAVAKYIWTDVDEQIWVACGQSCCKTSGGDP
jgi:hypothetical protein